MEQFCYSFTSLARFILPVPDKVSYLPITTTTTLTF